MTVKDILKKSATLSGREDVVEYLSSNTVATEETNYAVNAMLRLLNMVISELCASFVPMVTIEEIDTTDTIKYENLKKTAIEIVRVFDQSGNEIPFKVYYDHAKTQSICTKVEYKFHPQTYAINDEIDYSEKDISETLLAIGLSAEFALSEGDFDRACSLHERYVEGVRAILRPKNTKIKARSWA